MPQEYGGSGMGVTKATVMMAAIARSGAGLSGASAVHMNIFGLRPVVVFGSDAQKRRMLPLIAARRRPASRFTEPNTGLNTTKLKKTRAERKDHICLSGQKVSI